MEISSFFSILEKNIKIHTKKKKKKILRNFKVGGPIFLPLDSIENKNKSYCFSIYLRQGYEWGMETKLHSQS